MLLLLLVVMYSDFLIMFNTLKYSNLFDFGLNYIGTDKQKIWLTASNYLKIYNQCSIFLKTK